MGSPPQVRGKQRDRIDGFVSVRITPAGAGKTFAPSGIHAVYVGSPPQVRGKPTDARPDFQRMRITPAGAGKTQRTPNPAIQFRDHPRRCGENSLLRAVECLIKGSPPQVRGKLCANRTGLYNLWDHPRRCGENALRATAMTISRGSPPQVRGKLAVTSESARHLGITPAGAGKTKHKLAVTLLREDHPRRCGENCLPVSTAG